MCKNVEEERTNTKLRVPGRPGDAVGRAGIPGPAASPGPGCLRHFPCAGEDVGCCPESHQVPPVLTPAFPGVRSQALLRLRGGSEAGPGRARRA